MVALWQTGGQKNAEGQKRGENDKGQGEKSDILPLPLKWLQIYQMNSKKKN